MARGRKKSATEETTEPGETPGGSARRSSRASKKKVSYSEEVGEEGFPAFQEGNIGDNIEGFVLRVFFNVNLPLLYRILL